MMLKAQLRKLALQQRKLLTTAQCNNLSQKLLEQFKTLNFTKINSIHLFLPILKNNEPNTFLLIAWLQENYPSIEIIVPKTNFKTGKMLSYTYASKADLKLNSYHIPEPQHAKLTTTKPSMVLVPLLAFDEKGHRVGYGKGFYDRFLNGLATQKIGISFFNASTAIIDVHLNDIRLDKCITPNKIVEFKP